jgi:hypothetical protein
VISHRTSNLIKVTVDVAPADAEVARKLYLNWLEMVVELGFHTSGGGSSGPSGFVAYVSADHRDDVNCWLRAHAGEHQ